MSARDLAQRVRTEMELLSPEEQARFLEMVSSMKPCTQPAPKTVGPVVWADRAARLKEIFGDKVLEKNVVLEERESYEY
jgi:hypothetical protein